MMLLRTGTGVGARLISLSNPQKRCVSWSRVVWSLKRSEEQGLEAEPGVDGPKKPYIVYEGALSKQLRHVKIFSILTSAMGLTMQPVVLQNAAGAHAAATVAVLGMISVFTYGTPFLIHQLAKKYVTEITYDPRDELYTAATYSFFLRRKEISFSKNDVTVPDAPGPLTAIVVNKGGGSKTGLFIALESFTYPVHYGLIMGYDKPLDLHLKAEDVEDALNEKRDKSKVQSISKNN